MDNAVGADSPIVAVRRVPAQPSAAILIESMRDVGYTLETALADIVDNAIAAGAASIRVLADTSSNSPSVAIADDGSGMGYGELIDAMRLGNRSPLDQRQPGDLGRFGLGLKTASFSQCGQLTVISRSEAGTSIARWDLDSVEEANDWLVEIPELSADLPWIDQLGEQGTLIIWDELRSLTYWGKPRRRGAESGPPSRRRCEPS